MPHITLGRFNRGLEEHEVREFYAAFEGAIRSAAVPRPVFWTVTGACIMESARTAAGPEYRTVVEARFPGGAA